MAIITENASACYVTEANQLCIMFTVIEAIYAVTVIPRDSGYAPDTLPLAILRRTLLLYTRTLILSRGIFGGKSYFCIWEGEVPAEPNA